ncbi:ABC transporter ATP-binding protein [Christensenellaceae bacterium OttesenSCG-928-L17]|nr:ABC transporter ATP-binding protein [Christensenellaceae bacterium OttesenSCG-928-L17]
MIEINGISKSFGNTIALENIQSRIPDSSIFGLVGSNGAGKSTLLRLIGGVYRPNSGNVLLDSIPVFNNPAAKRNIVSVADEWYCLPQSNMRRMAKVYASVYPDFSFSRFEELVGLFRLNPAAPLATFSKGMRRQASILLSLCCGAKVLLLDETFDGLDPVVRELVKRLLYMQMEQFQSTIIIASHSLRELEDTCDQLALLHQGGIVFESDIQNLKTSLFKVQIAFSEEFDRTVFRGDELVSFQKQGAVAMAIVRGDREEVRTRLYAKNPLLLEILPLSLEEVFVHEMDALGYSFDQTLLGQEVRHETK